jgi:hypothetical protein
MSEFLRSSTGQFEIDLRGDRMHLDGRPLKAIESSYEFLKVLVRNETVLLHFRRGILRLELQ